VIILLIIFTSNVKKIWYGEFIEDLKPRLKETRYSLYLIRKSPLVVVGILIIIFMVSIALLAPFLATYEGEERVWADTSPVTGGLPPGAPSNDLRKNNEILKPQTTQDIELYPQTINGSFEITEENVETGEPPRVFFGAEVIDTGVDQIPVTIFIAIYEIDLETFETLSESQREQYIVETANATTKVTQYLVLEADPTTYVYVIWFDASQKTNTWSVNIRIILTYKTFYPDHIWGTDNYGGDIYSRVLWGAQEDLRIAISVVIVAVSVGAVIGAASGYFGGVLDELVMRITDIFFAFPGLVLAMAIVMALGERNLSNISVALMITWWPTYARLVRGQVLAEREKLYIEAARSVGATDTRILLVHILPNTIQPLIVQATMDIGSVLLVAAGLAFIGFGPPVGTPEWGLMISSGQDYLLIAPWMTLYPGLAILVTALAFNLVGDGIRDIMDPKLRRR
jgi:peptide/nickel transport system permease protein